MLGDKLLGAAAAGLLIAVTAVWANGVNAAVTQPYLDEFFHVRQAQAYCDGRFSQWDPKITTPPGLYFISAALQRLGLLLDCRLSQLRYLNNLLPPALLLIGIGLNRAIDVSADPAQYKPRDVARSTVRAVHTALNICLFPPLFFFTALYYTDVVSTVSVLMTFSLQQNQALQSMPVVRSTLLTVNGLIALSFRQTNIFWVAVFPAVLDVVDVVRRNAKYTYESRGEDENLFRLHAADSRVVEASWNKVTFFDVPINDLLLEFSVLPLGGKFEIELPTAILKISLSIAVGALANLAEVIMVLVPYLILLASFITFVLWNGGVVLGDKSNHVATLHLPQMLYIWPLILFFSFPLLYPHVLANIVPCRMLPQFLHVYRPKWPLPGRNPTFGITRWHQILFWRIVATPILTAVMLLIIQHNTIIHPFTLADNRHYVFYVFRLLLRTPNTRYLVAPVYLVCAWAVIQGFCKPCAPRLRSTANERWEVSSYSRYAPDVCMTSYVLAWLATTTLTLVTAPLVEPRYFILPWIFWRLRLPGPIIESLDEAIEDVVTPPYPEREAEAAPSMNERKAYDAFWTRRARREQERRERAIEDIKAKHRHALKDEEVGLMSLLIHGDHRLWLETAWFLVINAVTGYMFLYKGFSWPQEPGKIQRFMW